MKIISPRPISIALIVSATMALASVNAHAAKLYKWVDDKGNISYQDQPPPKNAKILSEKTVKSSADNQASVESNKPVDVVVYTVIGCDLCVEMVNFLNQSKIPHIERPLETDRDAQARILAEADSIVAPTIFIGDEIIQGGNTQALKEALVDAGYEFKEEEEKTPTNRLIPDNAEG